MDSYIICGIILLICLAAIVFGLRILKEMRRMDSEKMEPGKDKTKLVRRK